MSALRAVVAAALLAFASAAAAGGPSVEATLSAQQGKKVTLRLESGEELTGTLAAVVYRAQTD